MILRKTNLFAGCALGLLLVSGAGCGDALEQDEQEPSESSDDLETQDPVSGTVAANSGPVEGFVNANPREPSCAVDPVKPGAGTSRPPLPSSGTAPVPVAGTVPASICSGGAIGDGHTCLSLDAVKLKASAACEANGGTLVELSGSGSADGGCANGTTAAKYACSCAGAPVPVKPGQVQPPPLPLAPPIVCAGGVIGDGRTCLDLGAIKLKASAACEASGSTLVGLAGAGDPSCPHGAATLAKFDCSCSQPGKYDPKPVSGAVALPLAGKEPWLN